MANDTSTLTPVPRPQAWPPPQPVDVARALGIKDISIDWLAGDGSDRCYYRIRSPELKTPRVLMQLSPTDAQALKAQGYDWVNIAQILDKHGVRVPRVVTTMAEHAALIIEDYGDVMLETKVYHLAEHGTYGDIRRLYEQAMAICANFLTIPKNNQAIWCQRSFDAERFVWELNFFAKKYLQAVTKYSFDAKQEAAFQCDVQAISKFLTSSSQYFVHRDFHSRNLMLHDDILAVIDFQDARLGPCSYDLVSLVFDSYVPFATEQRQELLQIGLATLAAGQPQLTKDLNAQWQAMLLQRQLKAIGSFGFLTVDKNRGNYLKYVEPALTTLEDHVVKDQRWPFLSHDLIKIMRDNLGQV